MYRKLYYMLNISITHILYEDQMSNNVKINTHVIRNNSLCIELKKINFTQLVYTKDHSYYLP